MSTRITFLAVVSVVFSTAVFADGPRIQLNAQRAERRPCEPVFQVTSNDRSEPYLYVDQGLASLPLVYPRNVLLFQRRLSDIGDVTYSLMVYRKDAGVDEVSIEGVAVHDTKAWMFTTSCTSENMIDGLATTLERIVDLPKAK